MADVTPIVASVQVDTGNASANLKGIKKDITEVKGALNEAGAAAKGAGKDVEGAGGSFGKLKEQISAVPGPLGQAGEGVGKLNTAFKALLANPIVLILSAIVAVLVLIYKAFVNTFEGGEKVEQVFAGIKAVGQSLLDNLEKIGSAIIKLFAFDFSGAIKDIKEVGDAAANAYNKMAALTKTAQELAREQATNDLEQAERAKRLAILREQATDEDVPLAKRKAALKDLQKASEENAKEDIDLAKRTTENKIAQLTLEKDGDKKNFIEIQKIKADQIRVETDNANELRRINKQLTAAEKQENAERAANNKAAAEAAKAEREKLAAFNAQLLKLQQDNDLSLIKDGYQKELQALANKIAGEKAANQKAFQDKKLTKQQEKQLDSALDVQLALQTQAITDKHNKEIEKKEVDFQKELAGIRNKTSVDAITDARQSELAQLEIGYQEKLAQAIDHYKDDSAKLAEIKAALDAQLKAAQEKAQEKFQKEDDKKAFLVAEEKQKAIIAAKNLDFQGKLDAVSAEQDLVQQAFDNKIISELEYNTKVAALAEARKTIKQEEMDLAFKAADVVSGLLDAVAEAAGKQTAIGKGLAVASATINTIESAVKSFNAFASIPIVGPALGAVAAAAALVSGYSNVKKILSVQVPGQGGGGSSSGAGATAPVIPAPIAPTAQTTQLGAKSISEVGNAAVGRSYVLESDGASASERNARLNRAARLGG